MRKTALYRGLLVAGLSVMTVVGLAGVASASATVTRFAFSTTETFADAPPECMPMVKLGVTNATDTGSGQITETANGFIVHFSDQFVYRTDFPDGSYLSGSAVGHHSFVATKTRFVFNDVVQEPRTIFAADGTPVGHQSSPGKDMPCPRQP